MSVDAIKRALKRKFGPLPAWAWALIAGIALYYYERRKAATATAATTDTTGVAGGSDAYGTYPLDTSGYGYQSGAGGGGSGDASTAPPGPPPVYYDPATDSYATVPPDWYTTPPPWWTPPPDGGATTGGGGGGGGGGPSTTTTPRPHITKPALVTQARRPALTPGGKLVIAPPGTEVVPGTGKGPYLFNELPIEIPAGATNIKRLATGAVEYTMPDGAIIEQAPGYPRYRVGTVPGSPAAATAQASKPRSSARTTRTVSKPAPVSKSRTPAPAAAPSRSTQVVSQKVTVASAPPIIQQPGAPQQRAVAGRPVVE